MFGWKRKTDKRLDEIEQRLERIERAIGLGYVRDTGVIYKSVSFRYGDDDLSIAEVVAKLSEKAGVTVCPARGLKVK